MQSPVRLLVLLATTLACVTSCVHGVTSVSRDLPERGPAADGGAIPLAENTGIPAGAPYSFDWPVNEARLTRGFLPHKRRPHMGIDLAAGRGTAILAARGGRVVYRGRDFRGYGRMVLVENGGGWTTLYAHLDKYYVEEGQKLAGGEMIGAMGRSGRATGVHLHFEIRKDKGAIDPLPLLPAGKQLAHRIAVKPGAEY